MKKIEVFVWSGINGLPSSSPFCLKVIAALRYKQIDHQITVVDRPPSWLKRGKLPAIKIDGQIVEDSTNILKLLDELVPNRALLYPTDEQKRAETLLLEDWSDESLYWFLVYSRWAILEHFNQFKAVAFKNLPAALRPIIPTLIRQKVLKRLEAQGIAQLPSSERLKHFQEACWCLEQKLSERSFLIDETITAADLAVFSILQIIKQSQLDDLSAVLSEYSLLTRWLDQIDTTINQPTLASL
ncbi:MAG: glutathione S-transferase N-terminal domain-containing protein [Nostoc sp.]|uniref:glutathione S-transferase family protein n=1 Tax=Nostoc sp. TaxID=1180 RepID=UPI002FF4DCC4